MEIDIDIDDPIVMYKDYRQPYKSILFVLSRAVSDFRLVLPSRWLEKWGYAVNVIDNNLPVIAGMHNDVIVCSRPCKEICSMLSLYMDGGSELIIDMDDDFYTIPPISPAYKFAGKGNKGYHKILRNVIEKAATLVTVNKELQTRYGRESTIIPNCWDENNKLWSIRKKHKKLSIGWIGTPTHKEDFDLAADTIRRIMHERKDVRLVIGGDYKIYRMFSEIPEDQKLFVPGMPYKVYPVFYSFVDIVIAPLIDNVFNNAKSNIKLIEAGASSTPFVASDTPVYKDWDGGGILVSDPDEWYKALGTLIDNSNTRKQMGESGREQAEKYTSEISARLWEKLLQ